MSRLADSTIPSAQLDACLRIQAVTHRFGGLVAVNNLSFNVRRGTIHALIGPNGAGKTTVFNLIAGVLRPTSGEIYFGGERIDGLPSHAIAARGIVRTFQNSRMFKNLSVLQNVLAGAHLRVDYNPAAAALWLPGFQRTEATLREEAMALLERTELADYWQEPAQNLPCGKQRQLELARALISQPRLLMLDEPTSGLNEDEIASMVEHLRQLPASGVTVLLIAHDMRLVMGISDWVTVLNFGRKIGDDVPARVQAQPEVVEAYLGTGSSGNDTTTT